MVFIFMLEKIISRMKKSHLNMPMAATGGFTPRASRVPMSSSKRKAKSFRTGLLKKPEGWPPITPKGGMQKKWRLIIFRENMSKKAAAVFPDLSSTTPTTLF